MKILQQGGGNTPFQMTLTVKASVVLPRMLNAIKLCSLSFFTVLNYVWRNAVNGFDEELGLTPSKRKVEELK